MQSLGPQPSGPSRPKLIFSLRQLWMSSSANWSGHSGHRGFFRFPGVVELSRGGLPGMGPRIARRSTLSSCQADPQFLVLFEKVPIEITAGLQPPSWVSTASARMNLTRRHEPGKKGSPVTRGSPLDRFRVAAQTRPAAGFIFPCWVRALPPAHGRHHQYRHRQGPPGDFPNHPFGGGAQEMPAYEAEPVSAQDQEFDALWPSPKPIIAPEGSFSPSNRWVRASTPPFPARWIASSKTFLAWAS